MKGALVLIALFALLMLILPLMLVEETAETPASSPPGESLAAQSGEPSAEEVFGAPQKPPSNPVEVEIPEPEESAPGAGDDFATLLRDGEASAVTGVTAFRILDETTGEIHTVPVRDFVRGAVAAEMPARFHPEALKAQAVAAHTYALHLHRIQQENPDPALMGADFSADPQNRLVYMTEETARDFYGEAADVYWEKICAAADEVLDLVLVYDDEPIVAAYHAISAGMTEDAANVWSGSAPYLRPAESEGDLLAPDYESKVLVAADAVKEALLGEYPALSLGEDPASWFGAVTRSSSGYVTEIEVGGTILHGKEIRRIFDLRSHNFDLLADERGFTFTVYGHGHGVGLSQYGADFMARQGATFREILANYYQDARLVAVAPP